MACWKHSIVPDLFSICLHGGNLQRLLWKDFLDEGTDVLQLLWAYAVLHA